MGLMAWELRKQREEDQKDLEALRNVITVAMVDAPDVEGVLEQTIAFRLKDVDDVPVLIQAPLEMAVFLDAGFTVPAVGVGFLDTATKGTLLAGSGSAAIKLLTSSTGEFSCKLTCSEYGKTLWVTCSNSFGSRLFNCASFDSVTFNAA